MFIHLKSVSSKFWYTAALKLERKMRCSPGSHKKILCVEAIPVEWLTECEYHISFLFLEIYCSLIISWVRENSHRILFDVLPIWSILPSSLESGVMILKWRNFVPSISQDLWYCLYLRFTTVFNRPNGNWKNEPVLFYHKQIFFFKEKILLRKKVLKYSVLTELELLK